MIPLRTIRRYLWGWQSWRYRKTLHRACPVLADLDMQERDRRRSHKRGAAQIQRAKREYVCRVLAGGEWGM